MIFILWFKEDKIWDLNNEKYWFFMNKLQFVVFTEKVHKFTPKGPHEDGDNVPIKVDSLYDIHGFV